MKIEINYRILDKLAILQLCNGINSMRNGTFDD